jgi:hypothetical protein
MYNTGITKSVIIFPSDLHVTRLHGTSYFKRQIKWVRSHQEMTWSLVVGEENNLQSLRLGVNMFSKKLQTADKGLSSSLQAWTRKIFYTWKRSQRRHREKYGKITLRWIVVRETEGSGSESHPLSDLCERNLRVGPMKVGRLSDCHKDSAPWS